MIIFLNSLFKIAAIGGLIALGLGTAFSLISAKYAGILLKGTDEQLKKLIDAHTQLLRAFKRILRLSPVVLVFLPVAIYIFIPEINAFAVFTAALFLELACLEEFLYNRWLIKYLINARRNTTRE